MPGDSGDALGAVVDRVRAKAPSACTLRSERRENAYLSARRAMEICNACRYCEGFCAVFPAMTQHREFRDADLDYLANLCHNCRGCFFSCQYAPPHEFGLNVPKVFAELRVESYRNYAWPGPLARLFDRNGTLVSLALIALVSLVLILTVLFAAPDALFAPGDEAGAFYKVIPWRVMAGVAGTSFCYSVLALSIAGIRFWRATGQGQSAFQASPAVTAAADILTLRNLGGGGDGCNDLDARYSLLRRRFHHLTFYGFLLCFAATSVATLYDHFLGLAAPYAFVSLPVQLGFWGGIGLATGTAGLAWVKIAADPGPASRLTAGSDFALLILLFVIAITGLLLLALRATPAMGIALAVHLGAVATLFLLAPYSKMVHGLYRSLALLRNAIDRRAGRSG